jgi:hypothetical protein
MNKEFVPYEEALSLKELGFDEPCFGYYTEDKIWRPASYSFEGTEYPFNSIWPYPTSPTYQQAFRWFREKYNLRSTIIPYWIGDTYMTVIEGKMIEGIEPKQFKTYEEAELECLRKLIQTLKK